MLHLREEEGEEEEEVQNLKASEEGEVDLSSQALEGVEVDQNSQASEVVVVVVAGQIWRALEGVAEEEQEAPNLTASAAVGEVEGVRKVPNSMAPVEEHCWTAVMAVERGEVAVGVAHRSESMGSGERDE